MKGFNLKAKVAKSVVFTILFMLSFNSVLLAAWTDKPDGNKSELESAIQSVFRNVSIDSLVFNDELSMYEVIIEGQIFYITKDLKFAILGHIFNISDPKQPVNLTLQKQSEITKSLLSKIDKNAALKIGSGPIEVVEISNPNCPHCRNLSRYFKNKLDKVTRYIYFLGIENDNKINYILCKPTPEQRVKAYEEVYLENKSVGAFPSCNFSKKNLEIASKLKIQGVPVVFIKGHIVRGANIELIDSLITTNYVDKPKKEGANDKK